MCKGQLLFGLLLLVTAACFTQARKLNKGRYMENYANIPIFSQSNDEVHALQQDRYLIGNILVAAGDGIYSVSHYSTLRIAGDLSSSANRTMRQTQPALLGSFDYPAGLAQTWTDTNQPSTLFTDKNNHCIRKLDRKTSYVYEYKGMCDPLAHSLDRTEYQQKIDENDWRLNYPTTLDYVYPNLFVLDIVGAGSIIVKHNVATNETAVLLFAFNKIMNFLYDSLSQSFILAKADAIWNVTIQQKVANYVYVTPCNSSPKVGLAVYNNLLFYIDKTIPTVRVFDKLDNRKIDSICQGADDHWTVKLPHCHLNTPSAIAVFSGYLYIGTSGDCIFSLNTKNCTALIRKLSINIVPDTTRQDDTTAALTSTKAPFKETRSRLTNNDGPSGIAIFAIIVAIFLLLCIIMACFLHCYRNGSCRVRILPGQRERRTPQRRRSTRRAPREARSVRYVRQTDDELDEPQGPATISGDSLQPPPYTPEVSPPTTDLPPSYAEATRMDGMS